MLYEVTVGNFRCFRDEQTVRLAPLTLLVGENSTGKTSFMALIRALWNLGYQSMVPDFKSSPYDLGSFDEIAHHRGARGGRATAFFAGFKALSAAGASRKRRSGKKSTAIEFTANFQKRGAGPYPFEIKFASGGIWFEINVEGDKLLQRFGTDRGSWETTESNRFADSSVGRSRLMAAFDAPFLLLRGLEDEEWKHISGAKKPTETDAEEIWSLWRRMRVPRRRNISVFASAPVRSVPRRTYDPTPFEEDPQGEYVPMYLANMSSEEKEQWKALKDQLERFGRSAGLFDEIHIRRFGARDSEPFQVQVRKFSGRLKGPRRNLIDVGYGVSQALPLITELTKKNRPPIFLLQQPEVHLHPSAQAALGTLLCEVAEPQRQLVVETHSDHILDRVRMEVRDGTTNLRADDVSILFFERSELDVRIHSLRLDRRGNVLGAPPTYRKFFLEETSRSLGL